MTVKQRPDPPDISDFVHARAQALTRTAYLLCGDLATAEDLVHSALVAALPRWSRIEHHYTYLRRSILHAYLDDKRRARVLGLEELGEHPHPISGTSADELGTRDALWRCVLDLPARERAVVVLRYYEDLDDSEIGAVLGIRTSSVRSHRSRALARIRQTHPHLVGDSS